MPTTVNLNLDFGQWLVVAFGLITTAFFSGIGSSIGSQIGLKLLQKWNGEKRHGDTNKTP